jgi:hypothetical protein
MRLSDARLRCRQTKLLYPNHRPPPWLTEDDTRDRSNRLLDVASDLERDLLLVPVTVRTAPTPIIAVSQVDTRRFR